MIINSLIKSFILTLIIEYIIIQLMFIKKKAQIFIPVLLVNMLTNPLVVYIYNLMSIYSFFYKDIVLVFLELLVVIVESFVYKYLLEIKWKTTLMISLISNMIAYLVGVVISLYV